MSKGEFLNEISQYVKELFVNEDQAFIDVRKTIAEKAMPSISVSPESGKLLYLLVKISGAKNVLEVGALGGYSGIWLARALPANGRLTSLELDGEFATTAQLNLEKAGLGDKVNYRIGPALQSFEALIEENKKFDFFFIDADKENYSNYLEAAIQCATPGALITADNVLWSGKVPKKENGEIATLCLRAFNEKIATDPRLESIVIPIGDGLAVARVKNSTHEERQEIPPNLS